MILYIRDAQGNDIVDAEFFTKHEDGHKFLELRVICAIPEYSKFLLANQKKADAISADFYELQELRSWLWEVYFARKRNTGDEKDYDAVLAMLREKFTKVAKKYKLLFVED